MTTTDTEDDLTWAERHWVTCLAGYSALFIGGSRLAFWLFPWLTLDRAVIIGLAIVGTWYWARYGLTGQRERRLTGSR